MYVRLIFKCSVKCQKVIKLVAVAHAGLNSGRPTLATRPEIRLQGVHGVKKSTTETERSNQLIIYCSNHKKMPMKNGQLTCIMHYIAATNQQEGRCTTKLKYGDVATRSRVQALSCWTLNKGLSWPINFKSCLGPNLLFF